MKINNLRINKKVFVCALSFIIATTQLTGCKKDKDEVRNYEYVNAYDDNNNPLICLFLVNSENLEVSNNEYYGYLNFIDVDKIEFYDVLTKKTYSWDKKILDKYDIFYREFWDMWKDDEKETDYTLTNCVPMDDIEESEEECNPNFSSRGRGNIYCIKKIFNAYSKDFKKFDRYKASVSKESKTKQLKK